MNERQLANLLYIELGRHGFGAAMLDTALFRDVAKYPEGHSSLDARGAPLDAEVLRKALRCVVLHLAREIDPQPAAEPSPSKERLAEIYEGGLYVEWGFKTYPDYCAWTLNTTTTTTTTPTT
jgi:hypothetical protein